MDQDPAAGQAVIAEDVGEAAAPVLGRWDIVSVHSAAIKARTNGERPAISRYAQNAAPK